MKILVVIFGVIGMLLSGFPCCSIDSCEDSHDQNTNIQTEEEHEDSDLCSPFMSCGSCPGFVISFSASPEESEIFSIDPRKHIKSYTSFSDREFIDRLWQPPRGFSSC
ncbi:hypothetical protein [Salegentibacter sp.]|uniref:hypothetical protein n=1 Tax=Salegentibacter sp. TaxID=1903072 RepID=UPI00356A17CA